MRVLVKGIEKEVVLKDGESILQALTRQEIGVAAPCGGKKTCGKCRIRVVKGNLPITEVDKNFLTMEQLEDGVRLACSAIPKENICIEVWTEESFEVVTASTGKVPEENVSYNGVSEEYGIAIDIGTTTIAVELIGLQSGQVFATESSINRQRNFGADVIARIHASNEGYSNELTSAIRDQLKEMILKVCNGIRNHTDVSREIRKIVISANTTMCHLLLGYCCEGLGVYPFNPVNIGTIRVKGKELFQDVLEECEVIILPGISTYVGADIVSGLLSIGMFESESVSILIDLGTNGEMAIGNQERLLVTSVAAGPAFEGGNISCGTGAVAGAISEINILYGKARYKTIQGKEPLGLCGSGVLELTAELMKNHLIDETGLLVEEYFESGYPVAVSRYGKIIFTQKDIREIQMAKAAVYSGLMILARQYGVEFQKVDKVYLAGGFGFYVNLKKAVSIGLIPREWREKVVIAGNTSLEGAKKVLLSEECLKQAQKIVKKSSEITLAMDDEFNELYTKNMYFDV